MPFFTLTYARVVILKRTIQAPNRADAERQAMALENDGQLGLTTFEVRRENGARDWLWDAKPGSEIATFKTKNMSGRSNKPIRATQDKRQAFLADMAGFLGCV